MSISELIPAGLNGRTFSFSAKTISFPKRTDGMDEVIAVSGSEDNGQLSIVTRSVESNPAFALSPDEKNKVEAVINHIPGSSYDQIANEANSLSDKGKLYLLGFLNLSLYAYAYDEKQAANGQEVIDYRDVYGAVQSIVGAMKSGNEPNSPVGVCGSIAQFTVRLAKDMGFEAQADIVHKHAIALAFDKKDNIIIFDGGVYFTGTSNYDLAMSMYQRSSGSISPVTNIVEANGKRSGSVPTLEGRILLDIAGYRPPVESVSRFVANGGQIDREKPPTLTGTVEVSGKGDLEVGRISLNGWAGEHFDWSVGGAVLNGGDSYRLGAIDSGYVGSANLKYNRKDGNNIVSAGLGYSFSYLNVKHYGEINFYQELFGTNSSVDVNIANKGNEPTMLHMIPYSLTYARLIPMGPAELMLGNNFNGVSYITDNKAGLFSNSIVHDTPFASVNIPAGDNSLYFGAGMPMEFLLVGISQVDNFKSMPGITMIPGYALIGGGKIKGLGGEGRLNTSYSQTIYGGDLDVNLSYMRENGRLGAKLSYGNLASSMPRFIPDRQEAGFAFMYRPVDSLGFEVGASSGRERWPGEGIEYSSATVNVEYRH